MCKKVNAGKPRPWEKPGDYLKNAEVSTEGNYNMIDGILNNAPPQRDDLTDGQTFDEIRNLAPETLPEMQQEKKPSVRSHLNTQTVSSLPPREKGSFHENNDR